MQFRFTGYILRILSVSRDCGKSVALQCIVLSGVSGAGMLKRHQHNATS